MPIPNPITHSQTHTNLRIVSQAPPTRHDKYLAPVLDNAPHDRPAIYTTPAAPRVGRHHTYDYTRALGFYTRALLYPVTCLPEIHKQLINSRWMVLVYLLTYGLNCVYFFLLNLYMLLAYLRFIND